MKADEFSGEFSGGGWAIPSHRIQTGVIRSNNWLPSAREKLRQRSDRRRPERAAALKKRLTVSAHRRRTIKLKRMCDLVNEEFLIRADQVVLTGSVTIKDIINDQSVGSSQSASVLRKGIGKYVAQVLRSIFVKLRAAVLNNR